VLENIRRGKVGHTFQYNLAVKTILQTRDSFVQVMHNTKRKIVPLCILQTRFQLPLFFLLLPYFQARKTHLPAKTKDSYFTPKKETVFVYAQRRTMTWGLDA